MKLPSPPCAVLLVHLYNHVSIHSYICSCMILHANMYAPIGSDRHMFIHTCTHAYTRRHTYNTHTYMHICIHACTRIFIYTHKQLNTCIHAVACKRTNFSCTHRSAESPVKIVRTFFKTHETMKHIYTHPQKYITELHT